MKTLSIFVGSAVCALCIEAVRAEQAYVELDYVEANGSQWVDTGVVGRYDTKAEIKVEWLTMDGDMSMLACRGDASTDSRVNFMNASKNDDTAYACVGWGYGVFNRATWTKDGSSHRRYWELDRVYTVETAFTKASESTTTCKMTVDGVTAADVVSECVISTGCTLALFGNNISGSVINGAKARCYGLKIWQKPETGGEYALVLDLMPVLKDGRAGFRDAVSGNFLFSSSSKDLIAGTDANTPDGYVDYVESDGNAYVDLGVVGESGVAMESRMSWVSVPGDGSYVASRKGGDTRFYLYHHYQSDTIGYGNYFQSGVVAQKGVVQDVRAVLKVGEQTLTINDTSRFARTDGATVSTGYNLYLFACNRDGTYQYSTCARCYSLKLWKDDVLVRDFRPCLKRGKACLYDQVSGKIFFAGAGTLKAVRLPTAGKPDYFVEYVASKGNNYFDTGVLGRNDTRAAGEFQLTQPSRAVETERNGYFSEPIGHLERSIVAASVANRRFYLSHLANANVWIGYGDWKCYPPHPSGDADSRISLNLARHAFDVSLENGRQAVELDGEVICVSNVTGAVDSGCTLYALACNNGGTANFLSHARLYSLKIWQKPAEGGASVLVRDFRPCMKNGQAGLYDAVKDEIIYPSIFVPEDCIGAPVYDDMKPVEVLEYVDSDGTQWIDTGVTGRVDTVASFKMAWLDNGKNPDVGFIGSRKNSGDTRFYLWHNAHIHRSFAYGQFMYVSSDPQHPAPSDSAELTPIVTGEPHRIRAAYLADSQTIAVDGTKVVDIAVGGNLNTGFSMYLFAYNIYGTVGCKSAARLYSMKIWQDGKLVRNFVPVRMNTGLNVLYDKVEQKAYPPKGGDFTSWGPSIGEFVLQSGSIFLIR